ncbi:MAG: N-acetylmuramoyl-L-alanine amidase [Candidatus Vogelbacteria bacterium]|nr:N-acetylmuramoyl-L-alanine amidase [Candidatus Vogelbacteria bacterium]
MNQFKITIVLVLSLAAAFFIWLLPDEHGSYPVAVWRLLSQVFPAGLTPESAAEKYVAGHLRVLVVPGHDNGYWGAGFGRLKEADLTLALGKRLADYLTLDKNLTVFTTRDGATGAYRPEFLDYFRREREAIRSFRARLRAQFISLVRSGAVTETVVVPHNYAPEEMSLRLYGINKWANEQEIDLVVHLHFNDYAGRPAGRQGPYRGFSIYVPERQLSAHRLSVGVAESVKKRLLFESPVSNLPLESAGVIEDQELIAVGARGSRDSASFLIEYGYIYEPRFTDPARRAVTLEALARRTAEGISNYFTASNELR